MQSKDNKSAGSPARRRAEALAKSLTNKNQAAFVLPPYQGVTLVDPSIVYAVQLTNAAADQIFRMRQTLEAMEPLKICGYSDHIEELGCKVTSVVDALIDFASAYAKQSV